MVECTCPEAKLYCSWFMGRRHPHGFFHSFSFRVIEKFPEQSVRVTLTFVLLFPPSWSYPDGNVAKTGRPPGQAFNAPESVSLIFFGANHYSYSVYDETPHLLVGYPTMILNLDNTPAPWA